MLLVRYDDHDPRDVPYRRRAGLPQPGAFFYQLGHEGDGPAGWPGRERRVYEAPARVGRVYQTFTSAEQGFSRQDIVEVFVPARSLRRLVIVGGWFVCRPKMPHRRV